MSSLKDPVTPIDLSPDMSRFTSANGIVYYFTPLFWALYLPDALIQYVDSNILLESEDGEADSPTGELSAARKLDALSWQALIITLAASAIPILGWWFVHNFALNSIFNFNVTPYTVIDLIFGWVGVCLGALAVVIYCWSVKNPPLRIAAQMILGMIASIMAGLYLMDVRLHHLGYFVIFAASGAGIVWGFYCNTLAWYEQYSRAVHIWILSISLAINVFLLFLSRFLIGTWMAIDAWGVGTALFLIVILRLDDWVLHFFFKRLLSSGRYPQYPQYIYNTTPRVTWVKWPKLTKVLKSDLDQWDRGLQNCAQVLRYTNQQRAVLKSIHTLLDEKSEGERSELVREIEQLWQTLFRDPQRMEPLFRLPFQNRDLRIFLPRSLFGSIKYAFLSLQERFRHGPEKTGPEQRRADRLQMQPREAQRKPLAQKIKLNTPVARSVAGLWYLEQEYPKEAGEAFEEVQFSPLGDEMAQIAQMLETLWTSENLSDSGVLDIPLSPRNPAHGDTWESFELFRNIVRYVWLLRRCGDEGKNSLVKGMLLDAIRNLLNSSADVVEKQIVQRIASDWNLEIQDLIVRIRYIPRLQPIQIPFVFTEPLAALTKTLLTERKAEQARLKVAWTVGNFQPVLICGQRQVGKTSLVQASLDSKGRLASVQLQQLGARSSAVHILQMICDEIQRQNIYPLPVTDRLKDEPYSIFSGYIKDVCLDLGATGLVIVLDGFEFVEQQTKRLEIRGLMAFLWSLSQTEPNLGIAFLTTSTLTELNETFDTSFTRYMQPMMLGFLTKKGIAKLLQNPTPDFLPYCHDLAIQRIMDLTAGQPYLVQLSAWFLFDWYNRQIHAGNAQDPLLTDVDVNQALGSADFYLQCERYCRGIVDEAKQIDPEYAYPIVEQIVHRLDDPSSDELLSQNPERPRINVILERLEEHLIIERIQTDANMPPRWQIKVPLFREWLKRQYKQALRHRV